MGRWGAVNGPAAYVYIQYVAQSYEYFALSRGRKLRDSRDSRVKAASGREKG